MAAALIYLRKGYGACHLSGEAWFGFIMRMISGLLWFEGSGGSTGRKKNRIGFGNRCQKYFVR